MRFTLLSASKLPKPHRHMAVLAGVYMHQPASVTTSVSADACEVSSKPSHSLTTSITAFI